MPIQTIYKPDLPFQYRITIYSLNADDNRTEIQFNCGCHRPLAGRLRSKQRLYFLLRNIGCGTLSIDPNGGELIEGASTLSLGKDQWR